MLVLLTELRVTQALRQSTTRQLFNADTTWRHRRHVDGLRHCKGNKAEKLIINPHQIQLMLAHVFV